MTDRSIYGLIETTIYGSVFYSKTMFGLRMDGGLFMTIEQMRERKKELGYTNEQLSQLSGVPIGTLQKVLGGATRSPRYDTLQCIEAVLWPEGEVQQASAIREETSYRAKGEDVWDRQGTYTLDDYYALPDEKRVELIDGVFYDMAAPSGVHQELIGLLHLIFAGYVRSKKGTCKVFLSPFDVQLDCDNRTMVEPDLLVICMREKIRMRGIYGAPDLAIEIVSPSSRKKDLILKTQKYEHAGVREYWIIDPQKRQVIVYDFAHENYPVIYGFDDRIPVGIWDGDLTVDFSEISEEIAYLYEEGMGTE